MDASPAGSSAASPDLPSRLAWHWLWLAAVLWLVASAVAWWQPPPALPVTPGPRPLSLWQPLEINPELRLPQVGASLSALHIHADGQRGWAVGSGGTIIATDDGGRHWRQQVSGSSAALRAVLFADNGRLGWAVGDNQLLVTRDGGQQWQVQSPLGAAQLSALALEPASRRLWLAGGDGLLLWSDDDGQRWSPLQTQSRQQIQQQAYAKELGPSGTALAAPIVLVRPLTNGQWLWLVRADGSASRVDLASGEWSTPTLLPLVGLAVESASPGDALVLALAADGVLLASGADGRNWQRRADLGTSGLRALAAAGQRLWAVGDGGSLLISDDGGQHWQRQQLGSGNLQAVAFAADGRQGWTAGGDGAIWRSDDGGDSWQPQSRNSWGLIASGEGQYQRYPALWYWLLLPLWLAIAGQCWWRRRVEARPAVEGMAASDAAVASFADDRLGFAGLARGISRYLRNPQTTPPLTLAITGDWGSGKSSLMQLVCADLRRFGHRPIWFNAWHHQKQEHLFAALLGEVQRQALPPLLSASGLLFRLRLLWQRSRRHFVQSAALVLVISALLSWGLAHAGQLPPSLASLLAWWQGAAAAGTPSALLGWLSQLLAVVTAVIGVVRGSQVFGIQPAVLLSEVKQVLAPRQAAAQNDFRSQFAHDFGEVAAALPYRMVIVIDDLDRCRPEAVLEVMEAVNYLTSAGSCFVLFGMATERVQAALGLAFKEIAAEMVEEGELAATASSSDKEALARDKRRAYARDYLQKLVNIEIRVPSRAAMLGYGLLAPSPAISSRWRQAGQWLLAWWPLLLLVTVALVGVELGLTTQAPAAREAPPLAAAQSVVATPAADTAPAPVVAAPDLPLVAPPASGGSGLVAGQSGAGWWPLLAALGLLLLALAAGLWWLLRRTLIESHDSQQFQQAMTIWTPLVGCRRATPRAVKRFGNRIRYFAMLQQGEQHDRSGWGELWLRLRGWWQRRQPSPPAASAGDAEGSAIVAEAQLAAMGAIHEVWGEQWEQAVTGDPMELIAPAAREEVKRASTLLVGEQQQAIAAHCQQFGLDWPPSDAEREVFRRLLLGVRMQGEPRRLMPPMASASAEVVLESSAGYQFEADAETAAKVAAATSKRPRRKARPEPM